MKCKNRFSVVAVWGWLTCLFASPSLIFGWPLQVPSTVQPATDAAAVSVATADPAKYLPDIEEARIITQSKLEKARQDKDKASEIYLSSVLKRIDSVRRPHQIRLSLEEVVRRALANNYTIQTVSYNPAIETTRVVEAEAIFDSVLFGSARKANVDQPTAIELASTDRDSTDLSLGVRKLLPLGTLITGQYSLNRTKQSFAFQDDALNPAYSTSFILDIRQPLLRGFGLDYNRSAIVVSKNNRRLTYLQFRRQIIDVLRDLEESYWRLVEARRDVVISSREVADFEKIYKFLLARRDFDILPVSIFATEADLERVKADFVRRKSALFDAEDRLIAIMNDPEITLAGNIECIPTDFPSFDRLVVDPLAEVQAGLDNRTEIKEQELTVENAKVTVGQMLNQEMPQADLTFTTTVHGLGPSSDRSFSQASENNFITYVVGIDFEIPIGNRGPRAARRRAQLEHQRAVASLRGTLEAVVLEVNLAVRALNTAYDQIQPNLASMEARQRELDSVVARAERKDYSTLTSELNAWRALATTRRTILNSVVNHTVAIAELERAKGTSLDYNNVVIPDDEN